MIDIHCHILPGLDDGPSTLAGSVALARAFVDCGTTTVVATPHIRDDYPFDLAEIGARAEELRAALTAEGIELEVLTAGEVSVMALDRLDEDDIAALCIGSGSYILVESPYGDVGTVFDSILITLQGRGLRPVLAHPERCPMFQGNLGRVERLVAAGVLTSITAGSIAGDFGGRVRDCADEMLRRELVHDIASDAHDARRRPPGLLEGFSGKRAKSAEARWLTHDAPAAIVAGEELPPRPKQERKRGFLRFA
jgi:protein-tyrosine phosphatase